MQSSIISALSNYLQTQDLQELAESDDLMVTLVETLRDAILLDTRICLTGAGLDLLFTIASHGASNFQLTMLVNETFEEVTSTISALGSDAYVQLCEKVLPSLTGAFDIGNLTEENALTNVSSPIIDQYMAKMFRLLTFHYSSLPNSSPSSRNTALSLCRRASCKP